MREVAGPQTCKGTEAADKAGSKSRSQGGGSLGNEGQGHSYLSHVPGQLSKEHSKTLA